MCSIFGVGFFKDHEFDSQSAMTGVISALFENAEVGGRRASGLAVMRRKKVSVLRRPLPASELIETDEYTKFMRDNVKLGPLEEPTNPVMSIIGHCRLPTVGSPENNLNNHPVVVSHILGVHNGNIGNHNQVFNNFRKLNRIAEVDTEAIFQLIAYFGKRGDRKTVRAIQKTSGYLQGGYACGMMNAEMPYNLYLFRHGNPIRVLYYPKVKVVFFATREHFITESTDVIKDALGRPVEIEMFDDAGIAFNLFNKTLCRFRLERFKNAG